MNASSATRTSPARRRSGGDAARNGSQPPRPAMVEVRHAAVPGRLRLEARDLKRSAERSRQLQARAAAWPGVRRATASPVTGTLLLEFDPAVAGAEDLIAQVEAELQGASPPLAAERTAGPSAGSARRRTRAVAPVGGPSAEAVLAALPPVPPAPPRRQRRVEAALGAAAVAGAGAMLLAVRAHGHNLALDQAPLTWMAALHSGPLTALMRAASGLVDPPVVIPVTAAATALGVGRRRREDLPWLAPTAVAGGAVLIQGLKLALRRTRPALFPHLTNAPGYSLPSGHAFLAMSLYGLLAHHGVRWLRARRPEDRHAAVLLLAVTATAVLLVGISRVYLGVHYPTDVFIGYLLALLWLWLLAAINDRN